MKKYSALLSIAVVALSVTFGWSLEKEWSLEDLVGLRSAEHINQKKQLSSNVKKQSINNKQKGITLAKADPAMYSYLNAEDELIIGSKPNGVQVYAYEPQNKLGEFHFGVRSKR